MVAEVGATGQVLEIGFAKSLQSSHRVAANRQAGTSYPNQEVHLLQVCFSVSYERSPPAYVPIGVMFCLCPVQSQLSTATAENEVCWVHH